MLLAGANSEHVAAVLSSLESKDDCLPTMRKPPPSFVPAGVICNICQLKASSPLIAQCGHIACRKCWSEWIQVKKKKGEHGECPVCKHPVDDEQLAICRWKPLDSRVIAAADNSDEDDEDDLEIIV